MTTLSFVPVRLDLNLYAGDDALIVLKVWEDAGKTILFDFTGYTNWKAEIRNKRKDFTPAAEFVIDESNIASDSVVTLSLAGTIIETLKSIGSRWDLQVTAPDSRIVTIFQGEVLTTWDATK